MKSPGSSAGPDGRKTGAVTVGSGPPTVPSTDVAMGQAFDLAVQDLERIVDRHFAAHRTLVVEREGNKWTAAIGDDVLYRSPNGIAVLRFAKTFVSRTPGVSLELRDADGESWPDIGFSVRVPDNVVPIGGRA